MVTSEGAGGRDELKAMGTSDAAVEYAENPILEGAGAVAGEAATVRAAAGSSFRGSTMLVELGGRNFVRSFTFGGAAAVGAGAAAQVELAKNPVLAGADAEEVATVRAGAGRSFCVSTTLVEFSRPSFARSSTLGGAAAAVE